MDDEKKYKEALEKLQEALTPTEDGCKISGLTRGCIENIFPELAESEDEKIRKEIISALKYANHKGVYDKHLAWLEKQGEQKPIINAPSREVILAIWDLGNEWKELTNGSISTEYGTQLNYIQKHWHESEYYLKVKQGENHADKVESKFHEGDWVVIKANGNEHVKQIVRIEYFTSGHPQYILSDGLWFGNGTEARLWTIEDAKPGDVLYSQKHNLIWIYKDNKHYYASINLNYADGISFDGDIVIPSDVCPANKVQRSILFQKMKEAGYVWDGEKKELKKENKL